MSQWVNLGLVMCSKMVSKIMFLLTKSVFNLIKNIVKTAILQNTITIENSCFLFEYIIYSSDSKLYFSIITPVFSYMILQKS